jgi:hypothetical protein
LRVNLKKEPGVRKTEYEFDFASISIKGREAGGNIVARHKVSSVVEIK